MTRDAPGPRRSGSTTPQRPPSESVDLYEILEVSPRAGRSVIQAAYRALMLDYHPDRNSAPEAAQRVRQLNAAYRVLSDPDARARYDVAAARSRRAERLSSPSRRPVVTSAEGGRTPALVARAAAVQPAAAMERMPLLNAQFLLGALAVVAVTVIVLILMWAVNG